MAPFVWKAPVRFDDVDHAGIVYYPRFFHYFHCAFEELIRSKFGDSGYMELLDKRRLGFPAVHAECDFRSPLRYGDVYEISISVPKMGKKSVTFAYQISKAADRTVCADGIVIVAVTDLDRFVSKEPPEDVRTLFLELLEKPS